MGLHGNQLHVVEVDVALLASFVQCGEIETDVGIVIVGLRPELSHIDVDFAPALLGLAKDGHV